MSLLTGASKLLTNYSLDTLTKAIKQNTNYFWIDISFQSETETIYPISIKVLKTVRDYLNNLFDVTTLVVEMHPEEALKLIANKDNLTCTMIFKSINPNTGFEALDIDPEIYIYRAVINGSEDLRKKISYLSYKTFDSETGPTDDTKLSQRVDIQIDLFSEYVYAKRTLEINQILGPNVNISQVVNCLINSFQIEKCKVVPPENTFNFTNVVIPPMHSIATVFHYLQRDYGVYSKGLANYFFDDTFYLFRPFDTTVETDTTLHLMILPNSRLHGVDNYSYVSDEEDVRLVSINSPDIVNLFDQGSENNGITQLQLNTDTLIDHYHNVYKDGKVVLNQASNVNVISNAPATLSKTDANKLKYRGSSTNPFTSASLMASTYGTILNAQIDKLNYLPIYPGMSAKIHFDDSEGQYTLSQGIVLGTTYQINRIDTHLGNKYMYTMTGSVTIMMSPEKII